MEEAIAIMQDKLRAIEIEAYQAKLPMDFVLMAMKRQFVVAALQRCGNNQCKAAELLGRHRNTLHRDLNCLNKTMRFYRRAER